MTDKVQDIPGLYEALRELARVHTVWTPEGGLFTDGLEREWRILRMAVDLNVNPSPIPSDTARDIADGLIRNHYHAADLRDRLEAALTAYRSAALEEAAKVAQEQWARPRSGFGIASAIRALASKEPTP